MKAQEICIGELESMFRVNESGKLEQNYYGEFARNMGVDTHNANDITYETNGWKVVADDKKYLLSEHNEFFKDCLNYDLCPYKIPFNNVTERLSAIQKEMNDLVIKELGRKIWYYQ